MRRLLIVLGVLLVGALVTPVHTASAQSHTRVSLLADVKSIQPGKPFDVGLLMVMDPGWHTYWKNSGDSGLPTTINWKLPSGFTAGPIRWPAPHRISTPPLMSYGYENQVLLLVTIQPPPNLKAGTSVELAAHVEWLECQEVCLPGSADVKLSLPVNKTPPLLADANTVRLFGEARAQLPTAAFPEPSTVEITQTAKTILLTVTSQRPWPSSLRAYFFASQPEVVESAAPQNLTVDPLKNSFTLELQRPASAPMQSELRGVLTLSDPSNPGRGNAVEIDLPIRQVTPAANPTLQAATDLSVPESFPLPTALFFAFLGGIILNLMPCVLPVLSLKVLGLVQHAGGDRRAAWVQGLAFSAGVLVSFWALAIILLALRAAGEQLGWGFQMQSPVFIFFLAVLFFVFALNLFGLFEIGTSLTGVDTVAAKQQGWLGSFGMGALATAAATPCTAPFMGSALGFAVGQPAATALLIFTALALGMALPYLLLAAFPALLKFVPKPGAWMESFKEFLGFLLLGTVVFLLWVFGQQLGTEAVVAVLMILLIMGLGLWIYGRWGNPARRPFTRFVAILLTLFCLLGGIAGGVQIASYRGTETGATSSGETESHGLKWVPYSEERLARLRDEGKPVFIDFTAAWCVNCKVNEAVAFGNSDVREKLIASGIVMMKADWTRRDPAITRALARFGRNGVPLYVLYGRDPAAPPQILPTVLTPSIVLEALAKL